MYLIVSAIKTELFKQRSPSLRESSLPPFKLIRTTWDLFSNKLFIPLQRRVLNLYFYFGEQARRAHKAAVLGQGVTEHTADLKSNYFEKYWSHVLYLPYLRSGISRGKHESGNYWKSSRNKVSKIWCQFVEKASFAQNLKIKSIKNSWNSLFWILKNSSAAAKLSRAPRSLSNSLLT